MTENKQLLVNYVFESGNNKIAGQILLPYDGKLFYKPSRITVYSGYLDDEYEKNTGESSQKYRDAKKDLIKKNTKIERPGLYKVSVPFEFFNKGLVGFMGAINGYSSTRDGALLFDIPNHSLNGKRIAKVFQNLPSYGVKGNPSALEVVTIEELDQKIFDKLIEFENVNLDATKVMEVTND